MEASYEFMLIIKGSGSNADEAFADALERLAVDPDSVIHSDVTYERKHDVDAPEVLKACAMPLSQWHGPDGET